MPDYKKMYLRLFQASEDAINLLVEAQRECEEMFLTDETQQPIVLPKPDKTEGSDATQSIFLK